MIKKDLMESSPFKNLGEIEYFDFEEDFMEGNIRCIPMIVRFKLDAAGIKLKLAEWSQFDLQERINLARRPASAREELLLYHQYVTGLIKKYTGDEAMVLDVEKQPAWSVVNSIPVALREKSRESGVEITLEQWTKLTDLQRFALLKLCRSGHENRNFPIAISEFGLV